MFFLLLWLIPKNFTWTRRIIIALAIIVPLTIVAIIFYYLYQLSHLLKSVYDAVMFIYHNIDRIKDTLLLVYEALERVNPALETIKNMPSIDKLRQSLKELKWN